MPSRVVLAAILQNAIDEDRCIVGWNITFDIAWLIAYGLRDLVMQVKWIDGMRLTRVIDAGIGTSAERRLSPGRSFVGV